jgi:hypothetical protein
MESIAEDGFKRYFAEKLWEMIPAVYRHEDGLGENPGVLRGIVEVLAGQAAILRRSQDRLWEDQFIERCADWAVPYIADLLGTRLVAAQNKRGRRVDVAKTIYYRRRKGTPRVLEELISDISGWDGKMVEQFQRLGRVRHGLDPHPAPFAGRFSGTLPGGWADLRRPRASEVAEGPFDEFFHTPDVRRHRGIDGRYAIPKLAFNLYRLVSYRVDNANPCPRGDGKFWFDPSGRDIPLFNKRLRPSDWEQWHSALEWELPAPMRCRLLGHAEYFITEETVQRLETDPVLLLSEPAATDLRTLRGVRFRDESRLRTTLRSLLNWAELLSPGVFLMLTRLALVADCGKQALLPDTRSVLSGPLVPDTGSLAVSFGAAPAVIVTAEHIGAANLLGWDANPPDKRLIIDPERGRFMFIDGAVVGDEEIAGTYHYGFSGEIGAGTYNRPNVEKSVPGIVRQGGGALTVSDIPNDGIAQIDDNKTYSPVADKFRVKNLTLQAKNERRPYLKLTSDWKLRTRPDADAFLTLDGLWIGGARNEQWAIILRGDYECVTIRHCTIDPGGDKNDLGEDLFAVPIVIRGAVEKMIIDASITGPVRTENGGIVEELIICDSILQSTEASVPVLDLNLGEVRIERSTFWGEIRVHRLYASEVISRDHIEVMDNQAGCFRFSAASDGSRLPRPYESFLFSDDAKHWFTSARFGHPGYAQLSETAPQALRRGAENGSEMGAFSSLLNPIKFDGLRTKVEEYMPFGLIPIFINET